jgi:two-component system, cell cycle response regulator
MPARVLIASGFFPRAKAVELAVGRTGYETVIATRPADCLEICNSGWPDIVLLDGVDPCSGARELCRAIKADEAIAHVPILVLTDRDDPQQNFLALEAGADECLGHPWDAKVLLARLRSLVQWKRLSDEWTGVAAAGAPGQWPGASARRPSGLVLDADRLSRERLTEILSRDCDIVATESEAQALAKLALGAFDFVVAGLPWHAVRTSRLGQRVRLLGRGRQPRLLLVTGGGEWRGQDLEEQGIDDVILRPVDRSEVLARARLAWRKQDVATALRNREAQRGAGSRRFVPSRHRDEGPDRFAA